MMKKVLLFLLTFFAITSSTWGQLNANFSTNPLYNTSNQLTVCAGSSVLFTFISTGSNISSTTNVNWTFTTNSGTALSSTSSNLRTPFPITFPNKNIYYIFCKKMNDLLLGLELQVSMHYQITALQYSKLQHA